MAEIRTKVLIVDDEKGLRLGTQRLLQSEGYLVSIAENGTEGIRLGTEEEFDLAVIDLKMPDYDGLEVLNKIRQIHPNTVCFIATAFASYDTAIEATRLGAFSYIPKPFTPEEFLYQIEQGVKHRKVILESARLLKEREENLLELAQEKSKLNIIIKSIEDGVLIINNSGQIVYFNNSVLKNLDMDELAIGDDASEVLPAKISEIISKYFVSFETVNKSFSTQIEIKSDNELFIEVNCSPVPQTDGSFSGVVVIIRNITETKKIELIKNQFVSMVAHELKTPVAAVQGFLTIILDKNISTSRDQEIDFLSRSSVRLKGLLDLVNDLLDISRIEMKTKQRELVNLNIPETINSTLVFLQLEIEKKKLIVNCEFEDNLPVFKADLNELTRVFTNILSNAIKYNTDGGYIKIKTSMTGNYLCTSISDSGIGMTEKDVNNLFQEFFRAKNEFTRGISGTGLGLTIVKRIVESYHGKVEVESEYKKGTIFTIKLPITLK
ncbi:MAG: response regulator [Bacteroidetes bacterium]|nr:response regulator [Bacteroidota bacterium]